MIGPLYSFILLLLRSFIVRLGDKEGVKIEEDILSRMPSHNFIVRLIATVADNEGKIFKRAMNSKNLIAVVRF